MPRPDPVRVQVDTEGQTLTVEWTDGHTSIFPLHRLREACPCATCQGHTIDQIETPGTLDPVREKRWTDVSVEPAGSVGIRITWDDGHSAGIYRWDRLRQLQPASSE